MLTQVLPLPTESADEPGYGSRIHQLPQLPYDLSALEPTLEARTMALHHGKHHASYVEKLNQALQKSPLLRGRSALWLLLNPIRIAKEVRTVVAQNAGGHVNHSLFWRAMSPSGGGAPNGPLADAIARDFGSFEKFKSEFAEAGGGLFGSGWVWLVSSPAHGGELQVLVTAGHDNPMPLGYYPILVNDVWEHAYYLQHENRRADYLKAWWSVTNWNEAARRFDQSIRLKRSEWETEGLVGNA